MYWSSHLSKGDDREDEGPDEHDEGLQGVGPQDGGQTPNDGEHGGHHHQHCHPHVKVGLSRKRLVHEQRPRV